jgi:phenylalanyl-tRNA synthetase alpha chain
MEPTGSSRGHIHPISSLIREANQIFYELGFEFAEGPLVESEWYNFDALNVPKDHPARDMQDTFFMKDEPETVLRTHTSPVQIRYMESQMKQGVMPPYRMINPGRAFRNEATDMTHEAEFFQLEGLVVGEEVSLSHLKGVLEYFYSRLFKGAQVETRFRPSFFPFVEPGVEVDARIDGPQVPEKLRGKWIEMMGAGMVHPNVLVNAGVDAERYQGFAFGMGLDRLAMLRWNIDDVRLMHSADVRFVNQF